MKKFNLFMNEICFDVNVFKFLDFTKLEVLFLSFKVDKSIELKYFDYLENFIKKNNKLKTLHLNIKYEPSDALNYSYFLSKLIKSFSNLIFLEILFIDSFNPLDDLVVIEFLKSLERMLTLEHLDIQGIFYLNDIKNLNFKFPKLKSLKLRCDSKNNNDNLESKFDDFLSLVLNSTENLLILDIYITAKLKKFNENVINAISNSKNLRTFKLSTIKLILDENLSFLRAITNCPLICLLFLQSLILINSSEIIPVYDILKIIGELKRLEILLIIIDGSFIFDSSNNIDKFNFGNGDPFNFSHSLRKIKLHTRNYSVKQFYCILIESLSCLKKLIDLLFVDMPLDIFLKIVR